MPGTGLNGQYRRDGVARLEQVVAPEWIEALRAGVEAKMNRPGAYRKRFTPEGQPEEFFGKSGLAAIAARLMDSRKVNLCHEHGVVKEPGTRAKTPWHHEQPYFPVDGERIVGFWARPDPARRAFAARFTGHGARFVLREGFMSPPPPLAGGPAAGGPMDS